MSAMNPPTAKLCTVCGFDVASKPRVKDKQGRYFCEPCYAQALAKAGQGKKAPATAPPPPSQEDDNLFQELSRMEQTAQANQSVSSGCPGCGKPLAASATVCLSCGYDRRTGKRASVQIAKPVARAVKTSESSGGSFDLQQPWVVGVGCAAAIVALFLVAKSTDNPPIFLLGQSLFSAGVGIWVLVAAFQTGVGTGFLSLCVPLYALYFVYGKNDDSYMKYVVGVAILSKGLSFAFDNPLGFPMSPS